MAQATEDSSNATLYLQMSPAELSALAKRLRDMQTAATLIDGVARSSDLLVDVTDTDGKVNRSVPLWEAIGDDDVEYATAARPCWPTASAPRAAARRRSTSWNWSAISS
jgi:hypothetical protein